MTDLLPVAAALLAAVAVAAKAAPRPNYRKITIFDRGRERRQP